jgi:hyperpolarization activated cyclic nucleotide-gated potassium channel 2
MPKTPVFDNLNDSPWVKRWVFHPESTTHVIWDFCSLFCILFQAVSIPYRIGFQVPATGVFGYIEFGMTLFFISDICKDQTVVSMNTGYYSLGSLVMNRRLIFKTYFKTWFLIDLAASFPLNWFLDGFFNESQDDDGGRSAYMAPKLLRLFKVLRFLRILKLLRIAKLTRILVRFEDILSSNFMTTLFIYLRILISVFFLAHWTACFWAYLAGPYPLDDYRTWSSSAYIENREDPFEFYIAALYWSFTTMTTTGYGDIIPATVNEKIFTIFTMLLACGVFAFTLGSVSSLISKQNEEEDSFRDSMARVTKFMKRKGIPAELQLKVRRYLEYVRDSKKQNTSLDPELLNLLSEPLRDEVYSQMHAKVLNNCRIFEVFQPAFIASLTKLITISTFAPNDVVFDEGSFSRMLFFIKSGDVQIYHRTTNSIYVRLGEGKYFGEIGFFGNLLRTASVKCLDFASLLCLDRADFDRVIEMYPEAKTKALELQKQCQAGDLMQLGIKCFLCREKGHVAVHCSQSSIHTRYDRAREKWLKTKQPQTKPIKLKDPYSAKRSNKAAYRRFSISNVKGQGFNQLFKSSGALNSKVQTFISMRSQNYTPDTQMHTPSATFISHDTPYLAQDYEARQADELLFLRLPQGDCSQSDPDVDSLKELDS